MISHPNHFLPWILTTKTISYGFMTFVSLKQQHYQIMFKYCRTLNWEFVGIPYSFRLLCDYICACSPAIDKNYLFGLCLHSCIFIRRQQCEEFACELGHGCMRLSMYAGMWLFDQITETVISWCQLPVERVHAYVCVCACVCVSMMEHKGPFLSAPECGLCLVSECS